MTAQRLMRLRSLRDELNQLQLGKTPITSWSGLRPWIAKAKVAIRQDWDVFFQDFEQLTIEPTIPVSTGGGMTSFGKSMAREYAQERAVKERIQEILGLLDGIIVLETQRQDREFISISEARTHEVFSIDTTVLNELMVNNFSLEELKDLCFSLGIHYDELPHSTRREISRELIDYAKRHQMLPNLVSSLFRLRPDVDWL